MKQDFLDRRVQDIMESLEFHYQILHEMSLIKEKDMPLYEAELKAIIDNLNSNIALQKSHIRKEKYGDTAKS